MPAFLREVLVNYASNMFRIRLNNENFCMASIIGKSFILSGQYADSSSFLFASQNLCLDRKAALPRKWVALILQVKFRFMGCLPSKSKRPSIRKQTESSLSLQYCFYETAICREIFSKHFLASIFVNF